MKGLKELASFLAPTVAVITGSVDDSAASSSSSSSSKRSSAKAAASAASDDWRSPVYTIVAANLAVYALVHLLHLLPAGLLQLGLGKAFGWWQVLTSGLMTLGFEHLAEVTFFTYTFGRLVERAHGAAGLWAAYLGGVLGANALALWMFPAKAVGSAAVASAGALGLCVAGLVWPRAHRKPLEVACLAPLVWMACVARFAGLGPALVVDGVRVGHLVHAVGAVMGGSLVAGVFALVDWVAAKAEAERLEKERQEAAARRAERGAADGEAVAEVLGAAAKAAGQIAKKLL